jgi:ketosteroid isomerase-like protein
MKVAAGRIAIDLILAQDPNVAVVELSTRGRAISTGRPFHQSYVIVFETKDGKIWRFREYWNPLVLIEAFGEGWVSGNYP